MRDKLPMTAGILAGGKSSRMGKNKVLLLWEGTTFLEHAIRQTEEFSQVLVSAAEKKQYNVGVPVVPDERGSYGPLEGLRQILKHAEYEWVFLLAADLPYVNRDVIRKIAGAVRDNVQAVVMREENESDWGGKGGRIHPLCGLYHVSLLPVLEVLVKNDRHSMRELLSAITVRYLTPGELGIESRILENVNTPEEYRKLRDENESSSHNLQ